MFPCDISPFVPVTLLAPSRALHLRYASPSNRSRLLGPPTKAGCAFFIVVYSLRDVVQCGPSEPLSLLPGSIDFRLVMVGSSLSVTLLPLPSSSVFFFFFIGVRSPFAIYQSDAQNPRKDWARAPRTMQLRRALVLAVAAAVAVGFVVSVVVTGDGRGGRFGEGSGGPPSFHPPTTRKEVSRPLPVA